MNCDIANKTERLELNGVQFGIFTFCSATFFAVYCSLAPIRQVEAWRMRTPYFINILQCNRIYPRTLLTSDWKNSKIGQESVRAVRSLEAAFKLASETYFLSA